MKFFSTAGKSAPVSARVAVLQGLADDGGLFMPEQIPTLKQEEILRLMHSPLPEIGRKIAAEFFGAEITPAKLEQIISQALTFDAPLREIESGELDSGETESGTFALELFHGPTCAFKDFGARFMSQLLSHFAGDTGREVTVLVATSGDTGSAVASAFAGVAGTRVVLLYPSGLVSDLQERQLTTFGGNIHAIELLGTFDDCQRLVKLAFLDPDLKSHLSLASANSINVARLIPQAFYYVRALGQIPANNREEGVVISVPSGNFGNLTAGIIAKRMGFPIAHFVAATNQNDIVPRYLASGVFTPRASLATISNAMDVGNPSNFARLSLLYDNSVERMREELTGIAVSDNDTRDTIRHVFGRTQYVLDPHGAVGYTALERFRAKQRQTSRGAGIFLATAHPAKFCDVVRSALGSEPEMPSRLAECLKKQKQATLMPAEFDTLKSFLLDEFARK